MQQITIELTGKKLIDVHNFFMETGIEVLGIKRRGDKINFTIAEVENGLGFNDYE